MVGGEVYPVASKSGRETNSLPGLRGRGVDRGSIGVPDGKGCAVWAVIVMEARCHGDSSSREGERGKREREERER